MNFFTDTLIRIQSLLLKKKLTSPLEISYRRGGTPFLLLLFLRRHFYGFRRATADSNLRAVANWIESSIYKSNKKRERKHKAGGPHLSNLLSPPLPLTYLIFRICILKNAAVSPFFSAYPSLPSSFNPLQFSIFLSLLVFNYFDLNFSTQISPLTEYHNVEFTREVNIFFSLL